MWPWIVSTQIINCQVAMMESFMTASSRLVKPDWREGPLGDPTARMCALVSGDKLPRKEA